MAAGRSLEASAGEACELLGIGRDELDRLIAAGRLPPLDHGRRLPAAAVDKLLEHNQSKVGSS